jgi:sulfate transport system permease protein
LASVPLDAGYAVPPLPGHSAGREPARLALPRVLVRGLSVAFVSIMVLLPLSALMWKAISGGSTPVVSWQMFWATLTYGPNLSALELTLGAAAVATAINAFAGTIIAWVLVRDNFAGKRLLNAVIDLPFALPTVVAGVILLSLYGPQSPMHINLYGTRAMIALALLFVSLPFVVRAVQPVLLAMDTDMEEAAAVLGAGKLTLLRKIILPNLMPALLSGAGLGFARALGEFGSVSILSSNLANGTKVMSVVIYGYSQGQTNVAIGSGAVSAQVAEASLSLVLLAMSLATLLVFGYLSRRAMPVLEEE